MITKNTQKKLEKSHNIHYLILCMHVCMYVRISHNKINLSDYNL